MLQSEAETIQQQIENENNRHSREIARLKNALEQAKDDARAKRERNKRSRDIQANSAMQKQASKVNTYTQMSKWEDCNNCLNKQLIDSLREIAEKFVEIEF